jgi:molybdopterin-guanine dinucleotide biosynthesis protein A
MGRVKAYAALILAGGAGRRMGGEAKPVRPVGGVPMLLRVLAAVPDARPRIVVGAPELRPFLPVDTALTREDPPGGGPVAAATAGIMALTTASRRPGVELIALLAADLPLLTPAATEQLRLAADRPDVDGAVYVDTAGVPQWLCGVWQAEPLRRRIASLGDPGGVPMRRLFSGLRVDLILPRPGGPAAGAPWFDCDTEEDLRLAELRTEERMT